MWLIPPCILSPFRAKFPVTKLQQKAAAAGPGCTGRIILAPLGQQLIHCPRFKLLAALPPAILSTKKVRHRDVTPKLPETIDNPNNTNRKGWFLPKNDRNKLIYPQIDWKMSPSLFSALEDMASKAGSPVAAVIFCCYSGKLFTRNLI